MSDHREMKMRALAAQSFSSTWPCHNELECNFSWAVAGHIAYSTPDAVLALIAELERNKRMLLAACMEMGAIGSALDADMNADGDEILGLAVALKAENEALKARLSECAEFIDNAPGDYAEIEALRKDAGRYAWLRKQPTCYMTTEGWQIRHHWKDQNDSGRPHGIMSICLNLESLDVVIDGAMAKEKK
jgi:hypothetical protein